MKLKKIELQGFRGFRDRAELVVENGFTVIHGANGSGKSTLFDAVEFAITGSISKYLVERAANESVTDYAWWRGEGTATQRLVRVEFGLGDETFAITRTPQGADKTDLEIANKLCSDARPANALGVLLETALIRDESIAALSLDLSESERYQRVQRALGAVHAKQLLDRADRIEKKTEETRQRAVNEHESLRRELNYALSQLSQLQSSAVADGELKSAVAALKQEFPSAPDEISDLIAFGRAETASIRSVSQVKLDALDRYQTLANELRALETDEFAASLRSAEEQARILSARLEDTKRLLEQSEQRIRLKREQDALTAAMAELIRSGSEVGLLDGHCPLCNSVQSEENFRHALERGKEALAKRSAVAADADLAMQRAREQYARALTEYEQAEVQLSALRVRKDSISALGEEIARLIESSGMTPDEFQSPKQRELIASATRERMLRVEQSLRMLESSRLVAQIRELEETVQERRKSVERVSAMDSASQRAVLRARSIQHAISREAGELLDERLAMISPLLSELFLRLRPHADWRGIEYRIRGDVRRFLSLRVGDELNPQFVFSSGQRRITGLAFLLAVHLSRSWCRWRTLMLDDPVQHVDDFRALNLVEVLSAIRSTGRQVLCAVEDTALANLLCRRLRSREDESGQLVKLEAGPQGACSISSVTPIRPTEYRVLERLDTHSMARN